jgi:hypothetical protein
MAPLFSGNAHAGVVGRRRRLFGDDSLLLMHRPNGWLCRLAFPLVSFTMPTTSTASHIRAANEHLALNLIVRHELTVGGSSKCVVKAQGRLPEPLDVKLGSNFFISMAGSINRIPATGDLVARSAVAEHLLSYLRAVWCHFARCILRLIGLRTPKSWDSRSLATPRRLCTLTASDVSTLTDSNLYKHMLSWSVSVVASRPNVSLPCIASLQAIHLEYAWKAIHPGEFCWLG